MSRSRNAPAELESTDIRNWLKIPYRDGLAAVLFQPLDFIAHLAARVPKPHVNLAHFHGVFAPMTPGPGDRHACADAVTIAVRHAAMT